MNERSIKSIYKGASSVILLICVVALAFAGWPCDAPPTVCPDPTGLHGTDCDSSHHKWDVEGPTNRTWWACDVPVTGNGCSIGTVPGGGGCSQMSTKQYSTYKLTCNGSTRACVASSTWTWVNPQPNRTCGDEQCNPGDTIGIPGLTLDVCGGGGTWPPNSYAGTAWTCPPL